MPDFAKFGFWTSICILFRGFSGEDLFIFFRLRLLLPSLSELEEGNSLPIAIGEEVSDDELEEDELVTCRFFDSTTFLLLERPILFFDAVWVTT